MAATQHLSLHQFRTPGVSTAAHRHGTPTLSIFGKAMGTTYGHHGQQGITTTSVPDFRSQHVRAQHRPYSRH